jgi:hypothetical protein
MSPSLFVILLKVIDEYQLPFYIGKQKNYAEKILEKNSCRELFIDL